MTKTSKILTITPAGRRPLAIALRNVAGGGFNSKYYKLLHDPRWIKKHKKIRKLDNNQCTVCGSNKHLEIHHTFYYSDYPAPWKYPDDSLLTLCSKCHLDYHRWNESTIIEPPGKKRKKKVKHSDIKPCKTKVISLAELQQIRGIRINERKVR